MSVSVFVPLWVMTYMVPVTLLPVAVADRVVRRRGDRWWGKPLAGGLLVVTAAGYGCFWYLGLPQLFALVDPPPPPTPRPAGAELGGGYPWWASVVVFGGASVAFCGLGCLVLFVLLTVEQWWKARRTPPGFPPGADT